MTLATTPPIIEYLENGSTTVHAIPFQFQTAAEIAVWRRPTPGVPVLLPQGIEYTVTGGGGGTGSITKINGGTAGATLRIRRVTPRAQPTDYIAHDYFPADVAEVALDRQASLSQELAVDTADIAARAVRVPDGETVDPLLPAAGRKGKVLTFNPLSGALEETSLQLFANLIAPFLNVNFQGVPGPGNDLATHLDTYITAGMTDHTSAFENAMLAAQAGTGKLLVEGGAFNVDFINVLEGVTVQCAGKPLTHIFQNAGTVDIQSLANIVGSHTKLLDCTLIGNIATDDFEFHHGVRVQATLATGSLVDIEVDVHVQDARGDALCAGVDPPAYAGGVRLSDVRYRITGDNIFRNGHSITAGSNIRAEHWKFTRVGLYDWDIETDDGNGPVLNPYVAPGIGSHVAVAGTTGADYVDGAVVGALTLIAGYTARSVPAYPLTLPSGFLFRNSKSITFEGALRISGYDGPGLAGIGGNVLPEQLLEGPVLEIRDCQKTSGAAYVSVEGPSAEFHFARTILELPRATDRFMISAGRFDSRRIKAALFTGAMLFNDCKDFRVGRIDMAKIAGDAGAGGTLMINCRDFEVGVGDVVGDALCSFGCSDGLVKGTSGTVTVNTEVSVATRLTLDNVNLNGTRMKLRYYGLAASTPVMTIDEVGLLKTDYFTAGVLFKGYLYDLGGNQVVGARMPAIANPVGVAGPTPSSAEVGHNADVLRHVVYYLQAVTGMGLFDKDGSSPNSL